MGSKQASARVRRPIKTWLLLAAAVAGVALPAMAETTSSWINPVNGQWTDASKWSSNPCYPNNGSPAETIYDALIGAGNRAYTVTLSSDVCVDDLTINSYGATLLHTGGS
jgi:hypothetical protein